MRFNKPYILYSIAIVLLLALVIGMGGGE